MVSYVHLCGCLGRLTPIGETAGYSAGKAAADADACFVWRTDPQLLERSLPGTAASLYDLACDVADLYHHSFSVQLCGGGAVQPWTRLEVIWLELTDDGALLVFLKPASERSSDDAQRGWSNLPA